MRRLHLAEIEDQSWCPRPVRDAATDYLEFMIRLGNAYAPVAPLLREALRRTGARRIVDLCSGGGGPWPRLLPELGLNVRNEPNYPGCRGVGFDLSG